MMQEFLVAAASALPWAHGCQPWVLAEAWVATHVPCACVTSAMAGWLHGVCVGAC